MKINSKTKVYLFRFLVLGILAGTFAWAIIEKLMALGGMNVSLSVEPIGFDVYLLSIYLRVNPGSLIGAFLAYRLFSTA